MSVPAKYFEDLSYLRHKLDAGERPAFVVNVDAELKILIVFDIYEGSIVGQVFTQYRTADGTWIMEEGVDLPFYNDFIESGEVA